MCAIQAGSDGERGEKKADEHGDGDGGRSEEEERLGLGLSSSQSWELRLILICFLPLPLISLMFSPFSLTLSHTPTDIFLIFF